MQIKVGGKYRMKDYPSRYLYVHILGKVSDILPDQGISYYNNKPIEEFYGVVVYEHGLVDRVSYDPNLGTWGIDGSWDGAFLDDGNAIVSEFERG